MSYEIKPTQARLDALRALYLARARHPDGDGGLAASDLARLGAMRFDLALLAERGFIEQWPVALSDAYRITALGCAWLETLGKEPNRA